MPHGSAPLVSLIVLAYNQEQFIEEAIAAAVAQDYSDLEIVLSDDGSTDRTFKIMERWAATYRGPHTMILNQHAHGHGILAHVYEAVARSRGQLIVVAAGDDISYPHRVSRLAEAWQAHDLSALCSWYDQIDEDGRVLARGGSAESDYDPQLYFPSTQAIHISGVSSAYDRRVFDAIALPRETIWAEDYFFSLMLALRSQRVMEVPEALVAYRVHPNAISSAVEGVVDIEEMERRSARTAAWVEELLRLLEHEALEGGLVAANWGKPAEVDLDRLRSDIAYLEYRRQWLSSSLPERLSALVRFQGMRRTRWLLPRLFGVRGLEMMKGARRRIKGALQERQAG